MPWNLLLYPGEIHRQVQLVIAAIYGLLMEYKVKNGRCDLYKLKTREVWEVKPVTTPYAVALEQISRYIPGADGKTNFFGGRSTFISGGSFLYTNVNSIISVTYWNAQNGIIQYVFKEVKRLNAYLPVPYPVRERQNAWVPYVSKETITVVGVVAVVIVLGFAVYLSGGALAPILIFA